MKLLSSSIRSLMNSGRTVPWLAYNELLAMDGVYEVERTVHFDRLAQTVKVRVPPTDFLIRVIKLEGDLIHHVVVEHSFLHCRVTDDGMTNRKHGGESGAGLWRRVDQSACLLDWLLTIGLFQL